jgi:hypothetical protein
MHGGLSTGLTSPEGLVRIVAARTTHGKYSIEARMVAAMIRQMRREARRLVGLT